MRKREWPTCGDPADMLRTLQSLRAGGRKLRLFGVGCCRRVWDLVPDDRSRAAVEAAERFADGAIGGGALLDAKAGADDARQRYGVTAGPPYEWHFATAAAACVAGAGGVGAAKAWYYAVAARQMRRMADAGEPVPALSSHPVMKSTWREERAAQADLLRCVFGDPYRRPLQVRPEWFTSTAVALAAGIYEDRAFDRLPILADALMDAGCDEARVLGHCRDCKTEHTRGCWVVDALLGKE